MKSCSKRRRSRWPGKIVGWAKEDCNETDKVRGLEVRAARGSKKDEDKEKVDEESTE